MQIIKNWLKSTQSFAVGAMLYKHLGSNEAFKRLLEMGETNFARNHLVEELQKMVAPGAVIKPAVTTADKEIAIMAEGTDDVLKALKNEWVPLYQRMNLLRHSLDQYGTNNSDKAIAFRMPIAAEIKQLEQQCNAIWAKRDYYEENGKLPFVQETKLVVPTDPVLLAQMISNIKKYIRRYRKEMNDHPDIPKYAQLYNEYKRQHLEVTGKEYEEKEDKPKMQPS